MSPATPTLTRRNLLRLTALGATVVACAPLATAPTPTAASSPAGTAAPKTGGTVRAGLVGDITVLDGHYIGQPNYATIWMAWDTLTSYDGRRQPIPMLAESWDVSSDSRQVKLNLRKGVRFHTGREFTSDDVKYNLLRVRDPKAGASQLLIMSNWFQTIETPDKYTVIIRSDQPRPAVFDFFFYMNILDRDTMEGPDAKTKIVGTGPFVLQERLPGERMRFARNKEYWQSGRPYLDEVLLLMFKDTQSQVTQLEAGALDLLVYPAVRDAVRLQQDAKYHVVFNEQSGTGYYIGANAKLAPTSNKKFRQALNYAIDRKRFAETVLLKTADPWSLPWPPNSPAYEAAKNAAYPYDLDKARSLIRESGITNADIDLIYSTSQGPEQATLAQIVQSDAAKIGVTVNLKPLEQQVWLEQVQKVTYRGLHTGTVGFSQFEPSSSLTLSRIWNPQLNLSGFESDRYSQLIASSQTEPDAAKRRQLYSQINDILIDESFVMVTAPLKRIIATRANLRGADFRINESATYSEMWLAP